MTASAPGICERDLPRPSLAAVAALAAGMAFARAMEWTSLLPAVPLLVAALAFGRHPARRLAGLLLAFAGAGLALQAPLNDAAIRARASIAEVDAAPGRIAEVRGRVAGEPRIAASGVRFLIEDAIVLRGDSRAEIPAAIAVRVAADAPAEIARLRGAADGDLVEVSGFLRPIADRPLPGTFDHWLASQGAVAEIRTTSAMLLPGPRGPVARFRVATQRVADGIEAILVENLSSTGAALADAMLLGRTHLLTADQREDFQRNGLVHLFSVSGLHAGIVAMMVAAVSAAFGAGPRFRSVAVVLGLVAFCALTGFRAPAIRASMLATIFFLQPLLRREIDPLGALASVALAMLAVRPAWLWQLDFQLSFLCAATLVVAGPGAVAFEEWAGRSWLRGRWSLRPLVRLAQCLFLTTALQLALMPLLALHFGQASVVAPLANAAMLPGVPLAMGLGFAATALDALASGSGAFFFAALDALLAFAMPLSSALAAPAWSAVPVQPWPPWLVGAWYAALLCGRWLRLRPRFTPLDGAFPAMLGVAAAAAIVLAAPRASAPDVLCVDFIDVGQGDAVLVRTRAGLAMLVDTGPPAGAPLLDHLRAHAVERIDVLVLTHADADHIGGAVRLLESVPVGLVCTAGTIAGTETWSDVADAIADRGVPVATLRRGDLIHLAPQVAANVLHPTDEFLGGGDDRNEGSVAMRIESGGVSFLLTGDAEEDAEADMLAGVDPRLIDCDVLKAGHHGSASSTTEEFLAAATPAEVVASCGRSNSHGHPSDEVVQRCADAAAVLRRTDREGTISYETDGERLSVRVQRAAAPPAD